jgi:hypothetical protein
MKQPETDLAGALAASGIYTVRYRGHSIDLRYVQGRGKDVIFLFHGAVDRASRPIPKFQGTFARFEDLHQISIADPSLECNDELAAAWYIGTEKIDLQALLVDLIRDACAILQARKRIYFGGSAGGFAALFYGHFDPDSVVLAVNPQIDLATYLPNAMGKYLSAAWPSLGTVSEIAQHRCINVSERYASGFRNSVIYLQSAGDRRHLVKQLPSFLGKVNAKDASNLVVEVGFWGILGHSMSIPSSAYIPWLRAILESESRAADDLLAVRHRQREAETNAAAPRVTAAATTATPVPASVTVNAPRTSSALSEKDLDIARRIFDMPTTAIRV